MPMYEYICLSCKRRFELLRSLSDRDEPAVCPECGAEKKHPRATSIFSGLSSGSSSGGCAPGASSGGG